MPRTLAEPRAPVTRSDRLERGASIGRYLILDRLGAGGMGVVYAAYDPELDRKVAIKLLQAGAGAQASTRLLREAQAMARLQHPNVIAVYDVGSHGAGVFIAMELVDGETLADAVERRGLDRRELVGLYLQAGKGIAAAHAAGLVHRDFKPQNALVGTDGRVRVLDFGLARGVGEAADQAGERAAAAPHPDLLSTPLTRDGVALGTPGFMAPEQFAGGSPEPASDQFSFCAALYHALYGETPFAGETMAELHAAIMAQRVRPPDPRRDVPPWLRAALLRGLAPSPAGRHRDMTALLEALAADPAARRRRALLRLAAVAAAGLVVAAGAWAWRRQSQVCAGAETRLSGVWDGPRRAALRKAFLDTGAGFAAPAWSGVESLLDAYAQDWVAMRTEACQATRQRGDQSEELLDLRMGCLDTRLAELRSLGDAFLAIEATSVGGAMRAAGRLDSVAACADREALLAPTKLPADPAARQRVADLRAMLAKSRALGLAGKRQEATRLAEQAVAEDLPFRPLRAEALANLGGQYGKAGRLDEARATLDRAVLEATAAGHPAASFDAAADSFWAELDLSTDLKRARFWLDYGRASAQRLGRDAGRELTLLYEEAALLRKSGDFVGALARLDEALPVAERESAGRTLFPYMLWMKADLLVTLGRFDAAGAVQRRGLEVDERELGPEHPDIAFDLQTLAGIEQARDQFATAEELLRRALELAERGLGPEDTYVGDLHLSLAQLLVAAGRPREALAEAELAAAVNVKLLGESSPAVGAIQSARGEALRQLGRLAEAQRAQEIAVRNHLAAYGVSHPVTAQTRASLARVLFDLGRPETAAALLRESLAALATSDGVAKARMRFELARALGQDPAQRRAARDLAAQARARVLAEGGHPRALATEIDAWLARHPAGPGPG